MQAQPSSVNTPAMASSQANRNLPARWAQLDERAMAVAVFRKMHADLYPHSSAIINSCEAILLLQENKASNPLLFREAMGAERKNLVTRLDLLANEMISITSQIYEEKKTSLDQTGLAVKERAVIGLQHQLNSVMGSLVMMSDSQFIKADDLGKHMRNIQTSLARFMKIFDNINTFTIEKIKKKPYRSVIRYEVDPTAKD